MGFDNRTAHLISEIRMPTSSVTTKSPRAASSGKVERSPAQRLLLALVLALLLGMLLLMGKTAEAACWQDAGVTATGQAIAGQSFPDLQGRMPVIVVCSGNEFGPNVGGDYNSGNHRIRIPDWQMHSGQLTSVLQHELCLLAPI